MQWICGQDFQVLFQWDRKVPLTLPNDKKKIIDNVQTQEVWLDKGTDITEAFNLCERSNTKYTTLSEMKSPFAERNNRC